MTRLLVRPLVVLGGRVVSFVDRPLPASDRAQVGRDAWHPGRWALSDLRVLTVSHRGFDGRTHTGRLVVSRSAAAPLARVFRRLYELHFPIRHMRLSDAYGPARSRPADGDSQRQLRVQAGGAVAVRRRQRHGQLVGARIGRSSGPEPRREPLRRVRQSRNPRSRRYFDRSRHLRGMVTGAVVRAFASVGWGWGGSWSSSTKDYLHFSASGH